MKSFEYAAPSTLSEALALLSSERGKAEVLAGGTDLITCMKQGIMRPERLVSLRHVKDLRGVSAVRQGVRVGAMTSLAELRDAPVVRVRFPAVTTAITGIGSPQLLAMGTAGGDLCQRPRCWYFRHGYGLTATRDGTSLVREGQNRYHAIFATDGPALFVSPSSLGPPLIALGASVVIAGPDNSERTIPVAEFFRIPASDEERENALRPGEILTAIIIPDRGLRNATFEVRHRRGLDWPYVTASVAFRMEDQTARDARVVLGHVAPVPWSAREAEGALESGRLHAGLAARCGAAAATGAQPLRQNAYKVQMVGAAVQRAILQAADL